jgi:predicted transglutaminase-like cysteine proteinase
MNRSINSLVVLGFALGACSAGAGFAIADDTVSRATPTDHQFMKDCIERQKTADVTMSKTQMTRLCKDQMKQQKQTGVPPEPAPSDPPHN